MTDKSTKKDNGKRKLSAVLIGLLLAIVILLGSLFTFFSDIVTGTGTFATGTLDLTAGTTAYTKNDGAATATDLLNFNPGDVIVINVPITNTGSKSAWLRGDITLSGDAVFDNADFTDFGTYFEVYKGAFTKADVLAPTTAVTNAKLTLTKDTGNEQLVWTETNPTAVVNGNSARSAPEIEALSPAGTVPAGITIYDAAGSNAPTISYTIYFKGLGTPNTWQDKTFDFGYRIEAIQYRNNGEGGTAADWTDLVSAPFGS